MLRGDCESISVGEGSNIQDNSTVHADPGFPAVVGAGVTVGHNAVLHGCVIEDDVLVGMGATVLNGARIGTGSLVAAAALVPQGMQVPPHSLVAGVPAKVRRELTADERAMVRLNAEHYVALAEVHRAAFGERDPRTVGARSRALADAPGGDMARLGPVLLAGLRHGALHCRVQRGRFERGLGLGGPAPDEEEGGDAEEDGDGQARRSRSA